MPSLRRVALDRRALLRGAGACVALPWLDAMLPAMTRAPRPRPRAVFVFSPNGMNMDRWRVRGADGATAPGPTLAPLGALAARATVFGGLEIRGGKALGDGPGDHARAVASFLTCAHPRKTGGADLRAGVSVDQAIARRLGGSEPFRSLELGMERGRSAGVCDSGYSCAYSNNVSWSAPDQPVAKETDPRAVFARLFGDPAAALDEAQRRVERVRRRSILDLVRGDAASLRRELGAGDRRKLEQYLDSVRELEQRLDQADRDQAAARADVPDGLMDAGATHVERLRLMYELVALALATEQTRVVTLMLGNGGSNRSYRFLDVPEGHHSLSHHGKVEEKREKIARIDRFQVEQLAGFAARLAAEQRGERDLLADTLVLFGSGIGDGNRHNHDDLPMALIGEGGGAAAGRGYVHVGDRVPAANLYLAVMRAMGVEANAFADSDGALALR
ncbi:MAG: DUF1552 domain-containing protein [Planctomycetota bacterium]